MSATTQEQNPGPLPGARTQAPRKANGKVDRTIKTRRAQRKLAADKTAAAPIGGKLPMPQPLATHRLPKTITTHGASGIAAQTSAYAAFKADFVQSLLQGNVAPTEAQCGDWIAALAADLKMVQSSFVATKAA